MNMMSSIDESKISISKASKFITTSHGSFEVENKKVKQDQEGDKN